MNKCLRNDSSPLELGFSLVELLVAMALGLFLMAGVMQFFLGSKVTYQYQDELSGIQENARYLMGELSRDLRMAGYTSCGSQLGSVANTVEGMPDSTDFSKALTGYHIDLGGETYPSRVAGAIASSDYPAELASAWPGTDALTINLLNGDGAMEIKNHNANAAQFDVLGTHPYKPETIMVLVNKSCDQMGVFALSGPTNNSANAGNMVHNTGNSTVENCTKALGGNFNCSTVAAAESKSYDDGSSVMTLNSTTYFIRNSGSQSAIPGLYRKRVNAAASEELVQGVENMRVFYGLDSDADAVANQYLLATQVAASDWAQVVSVRVQLQMRSINKVKGDYLKKNVTMTVQLRNRGA